MENASSASENDSDVRTGKPKVKPSEPPPPINHIALAAMLRESASFVEKDQFDPILYQALQDFRAYYKQHNPSNRRKESPKKKEDQKRRKKKVTTTTTVIPPPPKSTSEASTTSTATTVTAATAQSKRVPSPTNPSPPVASKDEISVDTNSTTSMPTAAAAAAKNSKDPPGAKPKVAPTPVSAEPSPPIANKASASTLFGNFKVPKLHVPHLQAAFANTSKKNASRAKDDIAEASALAAQAEHSKRRAKEDAMLAKNESVWCEEHFTMGCACKLPGHRVQVTGDQRASTTQTTQASNDTKRTSNRSHSNSQDWNTAGAGASVTTSTGSSDNASSGDHQPKREPVQAPTPTPASTQANTPSHNPNMQTKPAFQRPANPSSALIANGWIEQQRRSKMRVVWKDVLASLVEGRKPGEENTLWIQREVVNAVSGKKELEALHQIPMKWLQDVTYLDYTADSRFTIKVYNLQEDFVFKCADDEAARNWVITLRSARDASQAGKKHTPTHGQQPKSTLDEWDQISEEKSSFEEEKKKNEPSVPQPPQQQQEPEQAPQQESSKLSIRELRATCHGAGINTAGMERGELQRAAKEVLERGTYFDAPPGGVPRPRPTASAPPPTDDSRARQEEQRRQEELRARQDALRKQQEMEIAEQRVAQAEAAKEEQRKKLEEETRRRVEEGRIKQAADEEHRRRLVEQEKLRQIAEQQAAEQRRRQEEEHRRQQQAAWQQQQAAWQKQQQEEDQRRSAAEQQAAEARKRQEEAYRRQQQFAQQKQPTQQHPQGWHQQQQHAQQQHWQQQQQQQSHYPQQQHWQQQQQQQHHSQQPRHNAPPQQQQQQQQEHRNSAASQKYAQMANQDSDNGQAAVTRIKHDILIKWALQPPLLQSLRPIESLITTIHTVFPPALGVARHDYFSNWTPIAQSDVLEGGRPDDSKLKKAVRKLRFFLHPDKLPRDLNTEQSFMVKMLWDITSDAFEEFHKQAEELDWIR